LGFRVRFMARAEVRVGVRARVEGRAGVCRRYLWSECVGARVRVRVRARARVRVRVGGRAGVCRRHLGERRALQLLLNVGQRFALQRRHHRRRLLELLARPLRRLLDRRGSARTVRVHSTGEG